MAGYSKGNSGFSLGVDLSIIAAVGDLPQHTYLRKVLYDPESQRGAARDVVDTWIRTAASLLESGISGTDLFPYPAIWALQQGLADHHLCFKHPTFAEEREWRLIKLVDVREEFRLLDDQRREEMLAVARERMRELGVDMPNSLTTPEEPTTWAQARAEGIDIKFRPTSIGLVPYVELALRDRAGIFTGRLPLWEVTQGPTADPELSLESLRMYLDSQGFGFHTRTAASGIPLRT